MQNTERNFVSWRVLWSSAVLAGLILTGVVLFWLFAGRVLPLLSSAATIGTTIP